MIEPRIKRIKQLDSVLSDVDTVQAGEQVIEVETNKLHRCTFDHYEIHLDDPTLPDLILSIQNYGIQEPIIVRPHPERGGEFEIAAGKRRRFVAETIGVDKVPCVVRNYSDNEIKGIVEDLNLKRGKVTYKEKILSVKGKYDGLKHQGKRTDLEKEEYQAQVGEDGFEKVSDKPPDISESARNELAKQIGMSASAVQNYVAAAKLIPELMSMLDNPKETRLPFVSGVHLSALSKEYQEAVYDTIQLEQLMPNQSVAKKIKDNYIDLLDSQKENMSDKDVLSQFKTEVLELLKTDLKKEDKMTFQFLDSEIKELFPKKIVTVMEMKQYMIEAIKEKQKRDKQKRKQNER